MHKGLLVGAFASIAIFTATSASADDVICTRHFYNNSSEGYILYFNQTKARVPYSKPGYGGYCGSQVGATTCNILPGKSIEINYYFPDHEFGRNPTLTIYCGRCDNGNNPYSQNGRTVAAPPPIPPPAYRLKGSSGCVYIEHDGDTKGFSLNEPVNGDITSIR